jgi:hypothetical protein
MPDITSYIYQTSNLTTLKNATVNNMVDILDDNEIFNEYGYGNDDDYLNNGYEENALLYNSDDNDILFIQITLYIIILIICLLISGHIYI